MTATSTSPRSLSQACAELRAGQTTQIRPQGDSMRAIIKSGSLVTLSPCADPRALKTGDVVLVQIKGKVYLHLIQNRNSTQLLIGNTQGGSDGWVDLKAVYGIVTNIEANG